MHDLPPMEEMAAEHAAWTDCVVREFRELGIDINEDRHTPLVRAIERWGEELAELRSMQHREVTMAALMEKRRQYVEAVA